MAKHAASMRGLTVGALGLAMCAGALAAPAAAPAGAAAPRTALSSSIWGDRTADHASLNGTGHNDATADPGSLYTIENAIGARAVWRQQDSAGRQLTGQGVTVALLDSGTASVAGLDAPGKLTYGPDLSVEGNGVLTDQDTYGHGTHLAGIIAADDLAGTPLTARSIAGLSPATQLGVAPEAGLLSLKLANTDGSVDVSQVIAGLNWVAEHQTAPDGSRIRVVNLSFGTASVQPYQLDPLAAAAENAWRHGLVVVVSGGNGGAAAGRLDDPAVDPYVLAVGASDPSESVRGWTRAGVASFSSSGSASRHVDLIAPGTSVVSLRDPGSFVDVNHPEGLVDGDSSGRLFRGSGTSQAAAVVSGAVALLLQADPSLTPDQVKAALTLSADPVAASSRYAGAGELDVDGALQLVRRYLPLVDSPLGRLFSQVTGLSTSQNFPVSTGQGSIEAARGGDALVDADGNALTGEIDVQGNPWNASDWWQRASALQSWSGGLWLGNRWTGDGWEPGSGLDASRWSASRWSASRWSASRWSDADWSSSRWSASRWSASRWSASRWSASRWSDSGWD